MVRGVPRPIREEPSGSADLGAAGPGVTSPDSDLEAIHAQVERARSILADAVSKLSGSFNAMDGETKVQEEVMRSILHALVRAPEDSTVEEDHPRINIPQFIGETGAFLNQFTDLLASVSQQSIRTVYRIDDMVEQLDHVFTLINSINGIADETFILAVNASLEAARTKEADRSGRSFSVIASNIRELSEKTRRFNDQIGEKVGKTRTTVNEVREIIGAMASRDLNVALSGKERIQIMLGELEVFQQFLTGNVDRATLSAMRVAESTSQAVTALQFEDILVQLMGSIQKHARYLAGEGDPSTSAPGTRMPSSHPVQQKSMAAGKIELF